MTKRTNQQNKSLHLFCRQLSDTLNQAGYDMRKTLKPEIDIPWTPQAVKEYLWKPIQKSMYQKESTTELDKVHEITAIHETLMRHLGEKLSIEYVPFPSEGRIGSYEDTAHMR